MANSALQDKTIRVNVISGDFLEKEKLILAMKDIDAVYLNDMGNTEAVKIIVEAMQEIGNQTFHRSIHFRDL